MAVREDGGTEIRIEEEIREKVHVSGREQTVRGLKSQEKFFKKRQSEHVPSFN